MPATALSSSHRHIETAPGVRGGKPCINGTRITVADIVVMHLRQGQTLEEIVGDYDLSPAAVYAAMTYYFDHRDEIDKDMAAERRSAEALEQASPSLLKAKLAAASGG